MTDNIDSKNSFSKSDVLILGNSIAGYSLAYNLIKESPTLKISVIGPKNRSGSATTAAGAMINAYGELFLDQLAYPAFKTRFELAAKALPLWDGLCSELSEYSEAPLEIKWGSYVISNPKGREGEDNVLQYISKTSNQMGYESTKIASESIDWYSPSPESSCYSMISIPDGRINPHQILAAYENALKSLGVNIIDDKAVKDYIGEIHYDNHF